MPGFFVCTSAARTKGEMVRRERERGEREEITVQTHLIRTKKRELPTVVAGTMITICIVTSRNG